MHCTTTAARTAVLTFVMLVTVGSVPVAHAHADEGYAWPTREALGFDRIPLEHADGSVRTYEAEGPRAYEVGGPRAYEVEGTVRQLETVEAEDGETTISLATDILFTPNSWELPGGASGRIEELVADIPDGASVAVTGHTDSTPTGTDFDNQELSENRAGAVADVLRETRADLELDVSGRGAEQPAASEDPEDPETLAENRRVEIVYEN